MISCITSSFPKLNRHGGRELLSGVAIATREELDQFTKLVNAAIPQVSVHLHYYDKNQVTMYIFVLRSLKCFLNFSATFFLIGKQSKGCHDTCGSSTFYSGQQDSTGRFTKLDETGLVVMCCRHGVTFRAANMFRGETYRIVAFLHNFALTHRVSFFCFDVICQYWPFAKK